MPGPINVSGFIPTSIAAQITQEATLASMALAVGNRVPMPAGTSVVPVPATLPAAAWTGVAGGRKSYTDFSLTPQSMIAEELAAVISIPDAYVEDVGMNLWNYARPLLAQALGIALDAAVFFGVDAPATFPVGGVNAVAAPVAAGTDSLDTVNKAMATVEAQGLRVTGHASDLANAGVFRGVRDAGGAFLLGPSQVDNPSVQSLYGVPIAFGVFDPAAGTTDFITGDYTKLLIGVRQDIRFVMSSEGVIADDTGKVIVSAWQDNQTLMKVWARYGCVIIRPVTPKVPAAPGANPFAKSNLSGTTGAPTRGGEEAAPAPEAPAPEAPAPGGGGVAGPRSAKKPV